MRQHNPSNIQFHYLIPRFYFPDRTRLKRFIEKLCREEGKKIEHINYIFCNDEYLLELNVDYLKHNTNTDIITFQLNNPDENLLADIYISVERVKENAGVYNSTFLQELLRVLFHGALHLCGYKDKSKIEKSAMSIAEELSLKKWKSFT